MDGSDSDEEEYDYYAEESDRTSAAQPPPHQAYSAAVRRVCTISDATGNTFLETSLCTKVLMRQWWFSRKDLSQ